MNKRELCRRKATISYDINFFSKKMRFLSMLCAFLVVWIHTYNIEVYNVANDSVVYFIEQFVRYYLGRIAVPFFFISCAFFLYNPAKKKTVKEVYESKFKSLVIPYVIWNTLYMVAFAILKHLSLTENGMEHFSVENLLGGVLFYKYNSTYWYMYQLILYMLLFPLFTLILKKGKYVSGIILLCMLGIYLWQGELVDWKTYKLISLENVIYFYIGAILGYHYREKIVYSGKLDKVKRAGIMIVSLVISIILFFFTHVNPILELENFHILRKISLIIFFFLIFDGLDFSWINGSFWELNFLIYSMHPLVLEIIEHIIYLVFPKNTTWALIDFVAAPILTILVICIACSVLRKISIGLFNLLNGCRKISSN